MGSTRRKRQPSQRAGAAGPGQTPPGPTADPDAWVGRQIAAGVAALVGFRENVRVFDAVIDALVDLDGAEGPDVQRPERAVGQELVGRLTDLWERGWEPLDLVHVAKREATVRVGRLATVLLAAQASRYDQPGHVPPTWLAQYDALGVPCGAAEAVDCFLSRWRHVERIGVTDSLECGLRLLARMQLLGSLGPLSDPPSAWGRSDATFRWAASAADSAGTEPKLLVMIRALLAKAESTTFPAEAEAFTAKAQDLMSRHAVDAAVLAHTAQRDPRSAVRPRRVHIDNPYGKEKAEILGVVAHVNHVRVVWDETYGMATIVGFPVDLDLVEMLTTSLLIQATHAMTATAHAKGPRNATSENRSPAFRRAFLLSYGHRIGDRLERARQRVDVAAAAEHGMALVPILAERREAVDQVTERLFPQTRPMRGRMVDARGWAAGRVAADLADLHGARPQLS